MPRWLHHSQTSLGNDKCPRTQCVPSEGVDTGEAAGDISRWRPSWLLACSHPAGETGRRARRQAAFDGRPRAGGLTDRPLARPSRTLR